MTFFALALVATVGVLICMGYFMLGSLPLLVLNHDTPLDARFIRGLFHLRGIVSRMDAVRAAMTATDAEAIARFRRLHVGGMLLNVVQLMALAGGMIVTRMSF